LRCFSLSCPPEEGGEKNVTQGKRRENTFLLTPKNFRDRVKICGIMLSIGEGRRKKRSPPATFLFSISTIVSQFNRSIDFRRKEGVLMFSNSTLSTIDLRLCQVEAGGSRQHGKGKEGERRGRQACRFSFFISSKVSWHYGRLEAESFAIISRKKKGRKGRIKKDCCLFFVWG